MKLLDVKCNFTMRFETNKAILFLGNEKHEGYVLTRNSYFNCDAFWLSWESCQQVFCSGIIRKCVWEKSALVKFFQFIAESSNTYAHTTSCQESIGCWYTKATNIAITNGIVPWDLSNLWHILLQRVILSIWYTIDGYIRYASYKKHRN